MTQEEREIVEKWKQRIEKYKLDSVTLLIEEFEQFLLIIRGLDAEIAALKARLKPVEDVYENLKGLKLNHYTCEDAWYSCPKSGECCHDLNGNDCVCGADTHNKKVDKIINAIKAAGEKEQPDETKK